MKSLAGAKPSWLSLLTNHGATWFTLVLHCAPLALDTNMLVYFRTLWHKFVIVWLLVSCGKCWYCMMSKHSGLKRLCFDVTQCQYLPCSSCNHIITNTCIIMCLTICVSTVITLLAHVHLRAAWLLSGERPGGYCVFAASYYSQIPLTSSDRDLSHCDMAPELSDI